MSKKNPTTRTIKSGDISEHVHDSSGNVFKDLGFADAGERLVKARLAQTICELIRDANLTQKEAGKRLGVDQPKVSALMRGKLRDFSTERLIRFVTALDHDVIITIREPEETGRPAMRVLVEA